MATTRDEYQSLLEASGFELTQIILTSWMLSLRTLRQHDNQKCCDRPQKQRQQPPQKSATPFRLCQSSIYQRECPPAHKELSLILHLFCFLEIVVREIRWETKIFGTYPRLFHVMLNCSTVANETVVPFNPSHSSVFWCMRLSRFIPVFLRL